MAPTKSYIAFRWILPGIENTRYGTRLRSLSRREGFFVTHHTLQKKLVLVNSPGSWHSGYLILFEIKMIIMDLSRLQLKMDYFRHPYVQRKRHHQQIFQLSHHSFDSMLKPRLKIVAVKLKSVMASLAAFIPILPIEIVINRIPIIVWYALNMNISIICFFFYAFALFNV